MKKIFLVEDEIQQSVSIIYFLQKKYYVTTAEDYKEAIKIIDSEEFDLYIIDMMVPSGNDEFLSNEEIDKINNTFYGIEVLKHIENNGIDKPVLIFSVVSEKILLDEALSINKKSKYICKYDCDINELLSIIDDIL